MLPKKLNHLLYEKSIHFMRKQAKLQRHTIQVDGHNIVFLESTHKEEETLFLIHGFNDEKDTWLLLADALKEKYHLIMIDLLGSGESDMPEDFDYSLLSQADFLQKVIAQMSKEKNISSYHLAGHSMGGGLAILLADKLPIKKLILIDSMGVFVKYSQLQKKCLGLEIDDLPFLNLGSKKELKALIKETFYKVPYIPSFILDAMVERQKSRAEFVKKKFKAIVNKEMLEIKDLTSELQNIKQNTLIVWGKEDSSIDVASAYKMQELVPNAKLVVYDACRHSSHAEKPKELAGDMVVFLS